MSDKYKPQWDIQWQGAFITDAWDINNDKEFDDTDRDNRMDYTPAMNALIKAYKNDNDIEKQAVYVFLMNMPHKTTTLQGYMPFNKQFAFVFTKSTADDATAHNIAHEIAHGTFNLRHTFSPNNTYTLPEKTTDNLMDYKGPGNHRLDMYQWDNIHDPQTMMFSFLQDEEEGAFGITTHQNLVAEAISKIEGSLVLNERNFKLLISTGLIADGGSILCDVNREMSNAELTEDLSTYLNSKLDDLYRIYNSPINVVKEHVKEQWIEFWSTPIEFPNMRNAFRRSWQYGKEMRQSAELIAEYGKAIYASNVKFDKLVITPNNKFKIELKDLTLLEDPDLCFNLLFRMQDYVTVDGEIKSLSLNGQGIDLIPEWMSSDVTISTQSSLGIKYVNKETQKDLFEITFDVNASLVNSVELVMSLNDVPVNFPLTCEKERTEIHFDNKYSSSQVLTEWSKIDNQLLNLTDLSGDKAIDMGLILHNVADFYAHSNFITEYIDWWMQQPNTNIKTLKPEHIPTYTDVVSNASNEWNLDWDAFWNYYQPIMRTGSWDLGGLINAEKKAKLPKPHHDEINLDASDKGKGGEKPDNTALCNYFEYARGVAYKHTFEILESKLK